MMKSTCKNVRLILIGFALVVLPLVSVAANPPRSWNHRDNPALMGVGNRRFFEMAATQSFGMSNSYFTSGEVLQPTFVLNLDDLGSQLGDGQLSVASTSHTNAHVSVSILGATASVYSWVDSVVSLGIPGSLFTLLAEGNQIDSTYSDSAPVLGRVFAEAGAQGSYRYQDWEIGVKLGLFTPILYTDSDAEVIYRFATDEADGTLDLSGGLNVPAYSSINFDDPGASAVSLDGVKLDLGVIKVRPDGDPWFGANIGGITLSPAVAAYGVAIENQVSISVTNPIGDSSEDVVTTETTGSEPTVEESVNESIRMPFKFGGFYRSRIVPWLALTGYGQVYVADPTLVAIGGMVEGAVFPLRGLSFSLGYDRVAWETEVGLRANLRVIDIGFEVGLSSPRFVTMWQGSGLNAHLFLAVGL